MKYELSKPAEKDLETIFDFTAEEFGLDQAVKYVLQFESSFKHLAKNPNIGRRRNEIKLGLRSIVKDSHIVFYRNKEGRIRIVRIIHGSRDLSNFF